MSVSENPYASPETLETSAPGVEWMQSGSPELAKTARGLSIVYFGIVLVLLSVISIVLMSLFPPLLFLSSFGFAVGILMTIIGPILCLSVPEATGAKGLITGSVLLQFVNLLLGMVSIFGFGLPPAARAISSMFWVGAGVLFVLFMRRLASFIGRTDLASKARNVLIFAAVIVLGFLVIGVLQFSGAPDVLGIISLPLLIFALVAFVMYANLINSLRKAIRPS